MTRRTNYFSYSIGRLRRGAVEANGAIKGDETQAYKASVKLPLTLVGGVLLVYDRSTDKGTAWVLNEL